jgi:hypothetical protein
MRLCHHSFKKRSSRRKQLPRKQQNDFAEFEKAKKIMVIGLPLHLLE